MRVTMLGTSSMVPTRTRGAPAVLVECAGESILIDCGEGTQRQMQFAGKSRAKIRKILLTHWHGDHVGGLAPLLQTMCGGNYQGTLEIWGPPGTLERMDHLARAMELAIDRIRVSELDPAAGGVETFLRNENYALSCAAMRHGLATVGYSIETPGHSRVDMKRAGELGLSPGPIVGRLQRGEAVEFEGRTISPGEVTYWQPGRKLTLVTDTVAAPEIVALAAEADVLISEATYGSECEELAGAYNHMTSRQAAELARLAGVKKLLLTHFSQRYEDVGPLVAEARAIFRETEAARDFLELQI